MNIDELDSTSVKFAERQGQTGEAEKWKTCRRTTSGRRRCSAYPQKVHGGRCQCGIRSGRANAKSMNSFVSSKIQEIEKIEELRQRKGVEAERVECV